LPLKSNMDSIADMIVIIKNGYMAKKSQVSLRLSNFKLELAKALEKEGYIGKVAKNDKRITIDLIYSLNKPRITEIKRVSKSGLRVYIKSKGIKPVKGGRGTIIVSTPKGLMSGKEAQKKNLGGEVVCRVW